MNWTAPNANASARALAAARVFVFGVWFIKILIDPLSTLSELPASIYTPLGPMIALPQPAIDLLLSTGFLIALKIALLVLCAAAAAGVFFRPAAIAAALLLALHQAVITGFSTFVDHTDLSLLLATFILSVSPCDDTWAARKSSSWQGSGARYTAPLFAIVAALSATYFLAGINRLIYGFPAAFATDTLVVRTILNAYAEPSTSWGIAEQVGAHPMWGTFLFAGTIAATIMELLAPLNLVSKRFRIVFIGFMLPFHALTDPLFNVRFWSPVLLFVFLVDFTTWEAGVRSLIVRWRPHDRDVGAVGQRE